MGKIPSIIYKGLLQGRHVRASTEKRLIGKHFAYKNERRGRCRVCSHRVSPTTGKRRTQKHKTFAQNVKYLSVLVNVSKYFTLIVLFDSIALSPL